MGKNCNIYISPLDNKDFLAHKGITQIQSINGSFLYFSHAVDPTIFTAMNEIATQQAKSTITPEINAQIFMDYLAIYPNTKLKYYTGDMKIHLETVAANLVLSNARTRVAKYFLLTSYPTPNKSYPGHHNFPILTEYHT